MTRRIPRGLVALLALGAISFNNASAQHMHDHDTHHGHVMGEGAPAGQGQLPRVSAEVRRLDTRANTLSLRHEEIPNLDMPPMTMVFQVSDPNLLEGITAGDRIWVTVDQIDGAYTVQSVEIKP
jgi:Cu/Ag efflux protein CusF